MLLRLEYLDNAWEQPSLPQTLSAISSQQTNSPTTHLPGIGLVQRQRSYEPYGKLLTASSSAFGFAGQMTDVSGLQYLYT